MTANDLPKGWYLTAKGNRLHALWNGHGMCGVRSTNWRPGTATDTPCLHCEAMYGVAFPAPPGRTHSSSQVPWFSNYAAQRAL